MEIKNYELDEYCRVFGNLIKSTGIKNIKVQYDIFKIHKDLCNEQRSLISFRQGLEDKYFIRTKDGRIEVNENNIPRVQPGQNIDEYIRGLNDLFNQGVEVNFRNLQLTFESLQPLVDAGELVAKDFSVLEKFMVENEEGRV